MTSNTVNSAERNVSDKVHPDEIRTWFSRAMSDMYRKEVPQYGLLVDVVRHINTRFLDQNPVLNDQMKASGELVRLDVERHGAIRLGTSEELSLIRRLFAVMGMYPVDYYDLSVAGLPVHSTAFRPIDQASLMQNPFRIFTSLIRLELLTDRALAEEAAGILAQRRIVTDRAVALVTCAEQSGGLTVDQAQEFVTEALETFRWHAEALVPLSLYQRLQDAHRLIADVVSFRGPHINHLTPRTLDIDAVQKAMPEHGIDPKAVVEGPPRRHVGILLRQTAFKALEEKVFFPEENRLVSGVHTARFGEIEQRGVALKPKGRQLYDALLAKTRADVAVGAQGEGSTAYCAALEKHFSSFPDALDTLRRENLAYFCYRAIPEKKQASPVNTIEALMTSGALVAEPQIYEDFLPVSAAGIFQSNLGSEAQSNYAERANRTVFEAALGVPVLESSTLYATVEARSLESALQDLQHGHLSGTMAE